MFVVFVKRRLQAADWQTFEGDMMVPSLRYMYTAALMASFAVCVFTDSSVSMRHRVSLMSE